mmetsp:Transcript_120725/g.336874  ORF Transcript_120725/g.336874 Transcript_120725/m.336874 type:complete len:217 (+) Transcript_120725:29-679(+)
MSDVLARLMGFGVLVGACIVKLPQVAQIAKTRSVWGISEASVLVEWIGYSATAYYSILMRYPFSAWGEAGIITLQCTAVLFMFWSFSDHLALYPRLAVVAAWMLTSVCLFTFDVPAAIVAGIGFSPSVLFVAARLPQVCLNFQQGHTGQLAPATFTLQLLGNMVRLFTTFQLLESDPVVIVGHCSSGLLNAIILLQIVRFRKVTQALQHPKVQKQL